MIACALTDPAGVVKPVDETECGRDGRQNECAYNDERSAGFHLSTRFWLQHQGAFAVEIGPHPGMLGLK